MTKSHAQRIFFDTEFTDVVKHPKLISIGFVSEDEREFYAELADTYDFEECSDFVQETVLPLLEGGEALMSLRELRGRLHDWLTSFGEPVTLATDSLAWDWPRIQELFAAPKDWPLNLDSQPVLLNMTYVMDIEKFEEAVEQAFAGGLRRHHALDDAKANCLGWIATGGDIETKVAPARFTV